MHKETLARPTLDLFEKFSKHAWFSDFYLAGGTGLALNIGHRISVDLDFFCENDFNEVELVSKLSELGKLEILDKSKQSITGILDDVKISFLSYKYPILKSCTELNEIKIASVEDIACMKLDAISSRGTKRDFIDLYFIAKIIPITSIFELFERKYVAVKYNKIHLMKSLVYFDDAEGDPMPNMIIPVTWDEVKKYFVEQIIIMNS